MKHSQVPGRDVEAHTILETQRQRAEYTTVTFIIVTVGSHLEWGGEGGLLGSCAEGAGAQGRRDAGLSLESPWIPWMCGHRVQRREAGGGLRHLQAS